MSIETASPSPPAATTPVHPLLQRLMDLLEAPALASDAVDGWLAAAPGHALLVFTEDPVQYRETLDIAVIVPELAQAFAGRFRTGVLLPADARAVARRYGFRRWPALVLLRDGRYVGAIDGLRDWEEYTAEMGRLLAAEPTRPPTIGVDVAVQGQGDGSRCH